MMRIPLLDGDTWQEVIWSLGKNRLRTLLTALGVFWGILMLTLLIGFGEGLRAGVFKDFGGLLRNTVFVRPGTTLLPYAGLQSGRRIELSNDDVAAVARLSEVELVAPNIRLGTWRDTQLIHAGRKTGTFFMSGATPEQLLMDPIHVVRGRFLNPADVAELRKVAVIGKNARDVLFGDEDPIGKRIEFQGVHFLVVGEHKSDRTGQQGDRMDNAVFAPLTTFQRSFNRVGRVSSMAVALRPDAAVEHVEKEITDLLRRRHRVHPEDQEGLRSFNVAEEYRRLKGLFDGIRIFVWLVGVLTLFAGILGVSNIVLITVKERTRELGIRKALGGTPASIVNLVVTESLALTCAAGYLGLAVGVALLEVASRVVARIPDAPLHEPAVDLRVVLAASVLLLLGGLLAAVVPARHAARLHPVEALRAE